MEARDGRPRGKGFVAATVGAFLGGVGVYVLVALIDPVADVSTAQFLSFDAKGELELEGVVIIMLLAVATVTAAVGCGLALRWNGHRRATATALLLLPALGLALIGASGLRDRGPEAAALSTIVCAAAARALAMAVPARGED